MPASWGDLRFILALARHPTLTAAAASLRVSQPTMGRRIAVLQRRLGAALFERSPDGYRVTEVGQALVVHAERIEEAFSAAERVASGAERRVRGPVKLTASEWLVTEVLAPALGRFTRAHPEVTVELLAEARWLNLPRRESDLAIRPARFEHAQVIQRRLAHAELGLYAAPAYLARRGTPHLSLGSPGHCYLTLTDDAGGGDRPWLRSYAWAANVSARANGRVALARLAVGGAGLACLPRLVGDAVRGLRRVEVSPHPPGRELWLGMLSDARALPRVRLLVDFITEGFQAVSERLAPGRSTTGGVERR